jgi:hypothetical protein
MRTRAVAKHSFVERALGVLSLREEMIREIVTDRGATQQALRALFVAAVGWGVGMMWAYNYLVLPVAVLIWMAVWPAFGTITYFLATRLFESARTVRNPRGVALGLGFAALPWTLYAAAVSDVLAVVFTVIALLWSFAISVVVLRLATNIEGSRAIGACVVGLVALASVLSVGAGIAGRVA